MIRNMYIFGFLIILFGCSNKKQNDTSSLKNIPDSSTKNKESIGVLTTNTNKQDGNTISDEKPEITPLPFGPKSWPRKRKSDLYFYDNLIGKIISKENRTFDLKKTYSLPEINRIKYIQLEQSSRESYLCNNEKPIDSVFRVYKYRYRLPNIGKYESYYMCNFGLETDAYSQDFINNCSDFVYNSSGYLILYNPKNKEAEIINIYHSYYADSDHLREFYIDKNFKIHLFDSSYTEGDDAESESLVYSERRTILISAEGEVKVIKEN